MITEIDWSKAPEGATHRVSGFIDEWRKADGCNWLAWYDGKWLPIIKPTPSEYIPRPAKCPWSGEGLPPIGTVCEVLWNESRMEYLRTKVFGVNEHGQPIHRFDEGPKKYQYQADALVTLTGTKVFRPLLTPEQIAAEERERQIEVLATDIMSEQHISGRVIAERLHALGYRKVNP